MKHWILMFRPETYAVAQEHGTMGVLHQHRRRFAEMAPGDRFVTYVSRKRVLDGRGTLTPVCQWWVSQIASKNLPQGESEHPMEDTPHQSAEITVPCSGRRVFIAVRGDSGYTPPQPSNQPWAF